MNHGLEISYFSCWRESEGKGNTEIAEVPRELPLYITAEECKCCRLRKWRCRHVLASKDHVNLSPQENIGVKYCIDYFNFCRFMKIASTVVQGFGLESHVGSEANSLKGN